MRITELFILLAVTFQSTSCLLVTTPEETLHEYYKYHAPDSEGMDPLILAGRRVVPLVMQRVIEKDMPKRQGAITFLGNGSYREAIPVLEGILADESEEDFIRAHALHAIFQIDDSLGREYAFKHRMRFDDLGLCATDIIQNKDYVHHRRTYWEAAIGYHE